MACIVISNQYKYMIVVTIGFENLTHLRSSETDSSLVPQDDHAIRKIEPSCPTSLHM